MRKILLLFSILLVGFLSGCDTIDPEEETPGFIKVTSPTLNTEYSREGSSSHDIRYGWVYVNEKLQGVYELPAEVYTPRTGDRNIKVIAGIRNNGMINDKIQYPFYTTFSTDRKILPDSVIEVQPVFEYFPGSSVKFWFEDFEDPNNYDFKERSASDTTVGVTTDPKMVYEGNGSGKISLNENTTFFLGASTGEFTFPTGEHVFLEMDYSTTDTLAVGILAEYQSKTIKRTLLNLTETTTDNNDPVWKKAYIELTPLVGEEANAQKFEVFIQSFLRENAQKGTILIDNYKVVYQDP